MSSSAQQPEEAHKLVAGSAAAPGARKQFWGKYRGTVLNNLDPEFLGRLMCQVSAVPGMISNWAMPCVPYAGNGVGFYAMPAIGTAVWVEFEGGDPDYPIWTGCFWNEGQVPVGEDPPNPMVKVLRTESAVITLSDVPGAGGVTVSFSGGGMTPLSTIELNGMGVFLVAGNVQMALNAETGVTISFGSATFSMSEVASQLGCGESQLVLTNLAAGLNGTDVSIAGNADVSVTASNIELSGATSVNGTKLG